MEKLLASVIFFTLRFSLTLAINSDIIYFFPLNSSTISGVTKNGSCTILTSASIQGSALTTVKGPDSSQSDPSVNLAPDNWVNLGDFSGTCISNPGLCTSGMTVVFWVRLNASGSGDRHIISTGRMDTSRGLQVFYTNSHTNVILCDGTKRYPAEISFPGDWTHVVAVYNPAGTTAADKFYVYVNGTHKETARYETSCTHADTETSLLIGHDNTSALFGGRQVALSQLAFFFRSLNRTEAQQIYSKPSTGIQLNCPEPTTTAASTIASASPTTTAAPTTAAPTTAAPTTAASTVTTTAASTVTTTAASTVTTTAASTVATTAGAASITSSAATGAASSSSTAGVTPTTPTGSSGLPSGQGQGQDNDDKRRPPTVLILLSFSLFLLLVIVIILIIGCCIIVPRAKEKGY